MSFPVRRLKYVATINDDVLSESTEPGFALEYVDIGNVDSVEGIRETVQYGFSDAPSRARRQVRHGDTIVSTVRTYLKAIAPILNPVPNLVVSTGFAVVRPKSKVLLPSFSQWALREPSFLAEVEARSVGVSYPAINSSDLACICVPLPPLETQRAIADYLDAETACIDALIAAKENLLAILAEKRRALVTQAVTRGLDPSVPMRDSGIPWLGEIPAHWKLLKVRHFANVGNGSTPKRDNSDYWAEGMIPWLNSSVVNHPEVTRAEQFVTETAVRECHLPLVPAPSVLVGITGQGRTRGMASVLRFPSTINQHLAFITPRPASMDCEYLQLVFVAAYDFLRNISDGMGGTKGALTCEALGNLRLPRPSLSEQRNIVEHVENESTRLGDLEAAARASLKILRERREAVIAAAVTGRLDVEVP